LAVLRSAPRLNDHKHTRALTLHAAGPDDILAKLDVIPIKTIQEALTHLLLEPTTEPTLE
jgi:hypothetical protein